MLLIEQVFIKNRIIAFSVKIWFNEYYFKGVHLAGQSDVLPEGCGDAVALHLLPERDWVRISSLAMHFSLDLAPFY